jgi:non-heme chloroperoxidase
MEAVGIEEATLVGDSSGGLIAQRVALDYPARVGRLVLIGSPTTLVNHEIARELWETLSKLEDPVSDEFAREFVLGTFDQPVPEEFLEGAVSQSLKVPARVWRDYWQGVALTVDDTDRFGEIVAPTLILWGEQDALLPREEQECRAAVIPNATLEVYQDTGHLAHWVRPERVVRDLEAFIEGTRPAV